MVSKAPTPTATHALVRGVPDSFARAIRPAAGPDTLIDVERARRQHDAYCGALRDVGLALIRLPADECYPDCPFVEDTAVVLGDTAIVPILGAESRRGEIAAVEAALSTWYEVRRLRPPATLDGGDVLTVDGTTFVGVSSRTNVHAVRQLDQLLGSHGHRIVAVQVRDILHLKSACTHLGDGTLVLCPDYVDPSPFEHFRCLLVEPRHVAGANCLAVNGVVLVAASAGPVRDRIEATGFETRPLDISEAAKAGAGLTCSSVLLDLRKTEP